jgi:uncharacterized membrane protein
MTAATAPHHWPATDARTAGVAWRFARALDDGAAGVQWILKRNCSFTPAQLFGVYLALCVVSLAIALGSTWPGTTPVLAFAGVELLLVGTALLVYARHAADQERITLANGALSVEHRHGPQTERCEFRAAWVRVEPRRGEGSLVELSGDGRQSFVGRYLRPEMRAPLAQELRAALRENCTPVDTESKTSSNQEPK